MLNVFDFGAVGDGKHDDTGAIQAALDKAEGISEIVYVPSGTYLCSTLQMHPYTGLIGDRTWSFQEYSGSVLLLADERAKCLINITGAHGITLSGLCLNDGRLGRNICALLLDKPDYGKHEDAFRIENCKIGHFSGDGVRLNRGWCFSIKHSMI